MKYKDRVDMRLERKAGACAMLFPSLNMKIIEGLYMSHKAVQEWLPGNLIPQDE